MKMIKKLKKIFNKKGFTLIELIVVIAVLGMISAIAIPKIGGITQKAKDNADKQTIAILNESVERYIAETGDTDLSEISLDSVDGKTGSGYTAIVALSKTYDKDIKEESTPDDIEYGPYIDKESVETDETSGSEKAFLPSGKEIGFKGDRFSDELD